MQFTAFVYWPSAPLTESLVRRALQRLPSPPAIVSSLSSCAGQPTLQWSTYDAMDHELTLKKSSTVLSSSITVRKALIRKHFLHRCIQAYTTKYPGSLLLSSVPRTWDIEISFADELDDLWGDGLWDLAVELEKCEDIWFILKPGMADRGMGIRLFNSKEALQRIFEGFDEDSDDENEASDCENTGVVTSQLRHFVIQEYVANPLLLDPQQVPISYGETAPPRKELKGRKFHLRAYCVTSGALTVYLYPRVLALFSSEPYSNPSDGPGPSENMDLRPHLTNTCLQRDNGEQSVRLLSELIGCSILSESASGQDKLREDDVNSMLSQMSDILAETFKAALQMPVHFQSLPNAFELYGMDFLISHGLRDDKKGRFQVKLLEINSEPAIEMTGPRLKWILEDLFELIGKTCVEPFFGGNAEAFTVLNSRDRTTAFRTCLKITLRA
ncbi:tubulin-tyrosine ligase [Phellopilus nigrolimitatus]|nr:tubulin-tyrosine ligase [Phellopilus nigrolimitatus]